MKFQKRSGPIIVYKIRIENNKQDRWIDEGELV